MGRTVKKRKRDDFGLPARSVCRHRYPGGPHTIPTEVDQFLCAPMWRIAIWVYEHTGVLPCRQARFMAVLGLLYFPIDDARSYVTTHDVLYAATVPLSILLQVFIVGATVQMERMHARLDNAETPQPTQRDVKLLYTVRQWRLVFVFFWLLPPYGLTSLFSQAAFVIWPMYAVMLGGPPGPNLWDRAKNGARRVRELVEAMRPRPAIGGAAA